MNVEVGKEFELTKHREFNEQDEMVREDTFVVSDEYLQTTFSNMFSESYDNINLFLDAYDPEIEGKALYEQAFKDDQLIYDDIRSIDKDRLIVILCNTLQELQEKTFEMHNDEFKSYMKNEIGVKEREWDVIARELKF